MRIYVTIIIIYVRRVWGYQRSYP